MIERKMYYTRFYVFLVLAYASNLGVYGDQSRREAQDNTKIVGGQATTIQKHPYQVFLLVKENGSNNQYKCGGSIATSRCVLTAAHCLSGIESVNIRAGSTDSKSGGTTYVSRMLTIHPQYDPKTKDYDLGIIRLSTPIKLDGMNTSAINTLSKKCTVEVGTNLTASGWGRTQESRPSTSTTLMEVSVDAVSSDECKKRYPNLTSRMICAGVSEGGKDTCQGDSGGPLVRTGTKTQVGITSFGTGCGRRGIPGVYTNLCNRDIYNWLDKMNCI